MKIVTVATHSDLYLPFLKKSIEKIGLKLEILGWGQKYTSHHIKDTLMIEYTEKCKKDDIILFIDGFDSIITENFKDIEKEFIKTKENLIVSIQDHNDLPLIQKIGFNLDFKPSSNNMYLNTGMYIGYSSYINKMLKNIRLHAGIISQPSNQVIWQNYFNKYKDKIYLDTEKNFFYNICKKKDVKNIIDKKIKIPFVISAPSAPFVVSMDKILKHYGYNITKKPDYIWGVKKLFYYKKRNFLFRNIATIFLYLIVKKKNKIDNRIMNIFLIKITLLNLYILKHKKKII